VVLAPDFGVQELAVSHSPASGRENKRVGLLSRIGAWLSQNLLPDRIVDLPARFQLGTDREGSHVLRAWQEIDGKREAIRTIESLASYGQYTVKHRGLTYSTRANDIQTVLAALSNATEIKPSGEIVFPVSPTVLKYLRTKPSVQETESSKEYEIDDSPLQMAADIDFDPETGMLVRTGYRAAGQTALIPERDLKRTADGAYSQHGKRFSPLPQHVSEAARNWLQRAEEVIAPDGVPEFFKRDLVLLKTGFKAVLTDAASRVQVFDLALSPTIRLDSDSRGWLEFQLGYRAGNVVIPQRVVEDAHGALLRPDPYTFVQVPIDAGSAGERLVDDVKAEETETGYRVPIARFASLEDLIDQLGGQRQVGAAYQQFLDDLGGFEADPRLRLSESAELDLLAAGIELRPYQRAGIHWLTWLMEHHLHGLLADDMGLGKTIQTAAAMRHLSERTENRLHSLVVCPKSVISHWSRELSRCYPSLSTYEYTGAGRDRRVWRRRTPTVVISTYATVARDQELISQYPLYFLVLDESTKIKNPGTARAQAVKSLTAAHRIALSGTPVENRPAELWSVFDFLMRGHLGRYGTFQRLFEGPILEGDSKAAERLGKRVGPFVLRRLKEKVAKDLPPKVPMTEWVELTAEQRDLYVAIQRREAKPLLQSHLDRQQISMASILEIITKLKQVCNHPALITHNDKPVLGRSEKFDRVVDLIQEIIDGEDQVLVFSQFLKPLDLLQEALVESGLSWVRLDGSVSGERRMALIDEFNTGDSEIAFCSLKAVGHGVNLTAANHVIHVDRWWNPAVEDQATDRAHRIGQTKTVFVHRVMVANTLEEKIDSLIKAKRGLSDSIMGAAASHQLQWTREELLELLKPLD
jgi:superfamily II DNA or RNA helicase